MSLKASKSVFAVSVVLAALGCLMPLVSARAADPVAGQVVFKQNCAVCHSPLQGRNVVGPSLFGVVGRHSGEVPGFHYSAANLKSNLTWDEATLDKYLTSPRTVVPGTIMAFPGLPDATKRADLIAYLATLK